MKLKHKFFLTFFITAFIPLLIITTIFYVRYRETSLQQMDEYCSNVFNNATAEANKILDDVSDASGMFSFYSTGNSDFTSVVDSLEIFSKPDAKYNSYDIFKATRNMEYISQNVLYSDSYIYGIYIFTPCGVILSSTTNVNGDISIHYNPRNDNWYKTVNSLNDKEVYISDLCDHDMFTGKQKSIFFAKRLKSVFKHKDLGILVIDCNPKMFDFNSVTAYSDITEFTIKNSYTNTLIYTNQSLKSNLFNSKNSKSLSTNLKYPSLTLTSTVNYTKLADKLNLTGIIVITVASICIISVLIAALILSSGLTRPITRLTDIIATQDYHNINLSDSYLSRSDEIGTLYNEFNTMIDKLNISIKQDYQNKLIVLDAQMKSLEAQINSHFLFNTLESINSMAEIEGCDTIATMALSLGNMFRYAIKTQNELVSIEEELNQVNDYVSIQMIRFENRFKLELNIPPELRKLKVLKLIMQPIVENSLLHGILSCENFGIIRINGYINNDFLYIEIMDNGCGIKKEKLELLQKSLREEATFTELGQRTRPHIGIKNIHTRIELYYGIGFGIKISSKIDSGTIVTIKLPIVEGRN